MKEFLISNGTIDSEIKVKVSHKYLCKCGSENTINAEWPKNLTLNSEIRFNGTTCPSCGIEIVLPKALYSEKDGVLIAE